MKKGGRPDFSEPLPIMPFFHWVCVDLVVCILLLLLLLTWVQAKLYYRPNYITEGIKKKENTEVAGTTTSAEYCTHLIAKKRKNLVLLKATGYHHDENFLLSGSPAPQHANPKWKSCTCKSLHQSRE